jgi:hypothetical protein
LKKRQINNFFHFLYEKIGNFFFAFLWKSAEFVLFFLLFYWKNVKLAFFHFLWEKLDQFFILKNFFSELFKFILLKIHVYFFIFFSAFIVDPNKLWSANWFFLPQTCIWCLNLTNSKSSTENSNFEFYSNDIKEAILHKVKILTK